VNVTASEPWNNVTACDYGDTPESVGTFRPGFAPQFSSGAALSAGVIAGVVAGATVAGLAAIAAGVWYIVRRHRRRRTQKARVKPSTSTNVVAAQAKGYESVPWTPQSADMKFYNPSDPSTYPNLALIPDPGELSTAAASATMTSLNTSNDTRTTTSLQPLRRTDYLGLPEV